MRSALATSPDACSSSRVVRATTSPFFASWRWRALRLRGGVKQLKTKAEFDAELAAAGGKLVVVDFTATWCGPCQMIAPLFGELSEKNPDVVFVKVDVDENQETAAACGINCMPTFQFYKNGAKTFEMQGADPNQLTAKVAALK